MIIKHPRIVETFEIGLTTEGAQYLVMEFLDGATLHSALVARDPHFEGRRVKFIREAAEGAGRGSTRRATSTATSAPETSSSPTTATTSSSSISG